MYTHHGTMFSYYSAKTRAYLGCKRLPFVERYDLEAMRERVVPAVGRTIIPVLEGDDGELIQDTTVIIDALESRHPERSMFPEDPLLMLVTRIVEFFVDEFWVVTGMHTRWNDPDAKRFAIADFNQVFGRGASGQAWSNGDRVAEQMQSYLPMIGIADEHGQRLMQRLFEVATDRLNLAVGPGQFALGERASLVDCCLYEAYYAHHYRDQGAAQLHLKREAPALCYYLDVMHAAQTAPTHGALELREPFLHYLRCIGPIAAAYATSVLEQADTALQAAAGETALEAALRCEIALFGEDFARGCGLFSAWKAQRVWEAYEAIGDTGRSAADELMREIGWAETLAAPPVRRMRRVGFELWLAE